MILYGLKLRLHSFAVVSMDEGVFTNFIMEDDALNIIDPIRL